MDKGWIAIIWTMAFIAFLPAAQYMNCYAHEKAHVRAAVEFGGEATYTINVSLAGIDGETQPYNVSWSPEYNLAQSNVDAFGYQLHAALYTMLIFLYMFGMLMIGLRRDW